MVSSGAKRQARMFKLLRARSLVCYRPFILTISKRPILRTDASFKALMIVDNKVLKRVHHWLRKYFSRAVC